MSDASFSARSDQVRIGGIMEVTGDEARHTVAVKRTRPGEGVLLVGGVERTVRGYVVAAERNHLALEVTEILVSHPRVHRFVVAQALAKGDRSELTVEAMTELGADEIPAWQASRSIIRWRGGRGAKSLGHWATTAREAARQSRRFRIPEVSAADTSRVAERIGAAEFALVLHESAEKTLSRVNLPDAGEILLVVGPEGGISPDELGRFQQVGAVPVWTSDGVLHTSTAGVIAIGQFTVLEEC